MIANVTTNIGVDGVDAKHAETVRVNAGILIAL